VPPFLDAFADYGGFWIALLGVLTWIAYSRLATISDMPTRWVEALSQPWVMKAAVLLGLGAWLWTFGLLYLGEAYLRAAAAITELSTILLFLILLLAGIAWWAIPARTRFHPWLTHGLVLALILSSSLLLGEAPKKKLSQETEDDERPAVAYIQGRLANLDCFEASREPPRRDGTFETLTANAVNSFQMANGLLQDPKLDEQMVVRPDREFRLLAKPFPFWLGPKPCTVSSPGDQN
jgi:putative peptidoglycan binding protein